MPHARRIRDLTDEHLRRVPGEIAVGAFAARMRRRRIMMGCAGAALLIAAALLYYVLRSSSWRHGPGDYAAHLLCASCGAVRDVRLPLDAELPVRCPTCGAKRAWPAWRCRDCGEVFVHPGAQEHVRCPKCRSPAVGSAATP